VQLKEISMRFQSLICVTFASAMLVIPAFAQAPAPNRPAVAAATAPAAGQWRASKLIGIGVYNEGNERLGDINEVIVDRTGKIHGVIIGVGGFLGMGEHDVMVAFDRLKWVNEPARTAATPAARDTTTTTGSIPSRQVRRADEKWYPDHAVLSATKDQLKSMREFKYD
jgi:sporulation protein YlmC with PRC-barrel domain